MVAPKNEVSVESPLTRVALRNDLPAPEDIVNAERDRLLEVLIH